MNLKFTCNYCDCKWDLKLYNESSVKNQRCPKCRSYDSKVVKKEDITVDYYVGCPAFPDKKEEPLKSFVLDYDNLMGMD